MSEFLLSQIIVSIGFVFDVSALQLKKRQHVLIVQALGSIFIAAHFFLLSAETAGWMFAQAALRNLLSLRWPTRAMLWVFVLIILALCAYSYDNYLSLISMVSSLLMTFGVFSRTDWQMRLLLISGGMMFLLHNLLVWTPVGIAMECLFVASGLLGYYRHCWRRRPSRPC